MSDRDGTQIVTVVERLPPVRIDESRCITYDIISTGTPDRAGDVLVSKGCDTSEHRNYPVVLWNHGRSHDVLGTLPIGLALDKSGNYGVQVEDDAVYSFTKYSQSNPLAVQLFALQAENVLRGNSVAARPVLARELPRRLLPDKSSVRCFQYDHWVIHEYSKTPGPVNAESLTIRVEKGRVNGEPLHPILKGYLEPMCVAGKEWANGWNFSEKSASAYGDGGGGTLTKPPGDDDDEKKKKPKDEPDPTAPLKRPETAMNDDDDKKDKEKAALAQSEIEKAAKVKEEEEKKGGESRLPASKEVLKGLKPSVSLMASAMQAARDFRVSLAKSAENIEDEMTLVTLSEVEAHLENIEKACAETMIAKGLKEAPVALTGEVIKSQLAENKQVEVVVIKGYTEPPRLLKSLDSSSNVQVEELDPIAYAKYRRNLVASARRAGALN